MLPSSSAHAAEGYTLASSTVYTLDETVPAVYVAATYSMTNVTPNRNIDGGVRYFYYDGMTIPIDAAATEIAVQLDGTDIEYTVQPDVDGVSALSVEFRRNLRYQQTATLYVSYRLPGDAPRTETSFVRVNPAYASFPVYGFGDSGITDVTVDVPSTWAIDYSGDDLERSELDTGRTLYTSHALADPLDFGVLFTARRDDQLVSTPLVVGDSQFEVRSWPDDPEWLDFAVQHIDDGVPVLERLTGTSWPETRETDVIEASTPYLRGYAGYYYADDDVIEVGEDLDGHTMLHELSHAWFNDEYLADRWLSEGLADEIGARAVAALGGEMPSPDDFPAEATAEVNPFPLNTWRTPVGLDDGSEDYGYRTSFTVLRNLYDEIGETNMTQLIEAVLAGERAYPGDAGDAGDDASSAIGDEADDAGPITWMEFLDLAEQIGGSTELVDDYRELVVTPTQAVELDNRDRALVDYGELAEHGGTWLPPEVVRQSMADWLFRTATAEIEHADAVLDRRDRLIEVLGALELEAAPSTEQSYETAVDLDSIEGEIDDLIAGAERLVTARTELTTTLDGIGLDVPPLDQSHYSDSPLGMAGLTEHLADRADELAALHGELASVLAGANLTVPALDADAFVESPEATIDLVEDRVDAAEVVAEAHRQRDAADSLLEQIGQYGSDADDHLADADAALARGDTAAAVGAADEATDALDDWNGRGRTRLTIAVSGLVAVVLGLIALVVIRRRRRRRRVSVIDAEPLDEAPALTDA